ncbi:MAG: hypothetical protein FH748_01775 [Balneolaceae bacterium]|nr:hypothetical protein [Balneolaceae bacterium]
MLQSFYNNLGFFGALGVSLLLFIFFIFWIAGIAGITLPYDGGKQRGSTFQTILAVLVPIYPIVWLIFDMYSQHQEMKED